jgi:hypothetical protein
VAAERKRTTGPRRKRSRIDVHFDRRSGIELATPQISRSPDVLLEQRIRFKPSARRKRTVGVIDVRDIER